MYLRVFSLVKLKGSEYPHRIVRPKLTYLSFPTD